MCLQCLHADIDVAPYSAENVFFGQNSQLPNLPAKVLMGQGRQTRSGERDLDEELEGVAGPIEALVTEDAENYLGEQISN